MPRLYKTAWVLLISAATLTFALTGFTAYNFDQLTEDATVEVSAPEVVPPPLDPATSAGLAVFKINCKSCHSIDQRIVGPALRNAYSRHDSLWLRNWITNSSKMIAAGDPDAVQVFEEYNKTQMTNFSTMKKEDLDALLLYLKHVDSEKMVVD